MKRIVFTLSLLLMTLLVSPSFATTNVGATISADTQWDASGSPYVIQARVLVPPGVTLKVGPGVQIVFQGPATLQIGGDLRIEGSAAAPAVVNMTDGGLQSALFIDGGEAHLTNMKVIGGVFLAQDATIRMDASEVTKGSGLYLKGSTVAHLKNNKFYGNATGVVLDGPIEADMQFNTLVQNTYGLYIKDYAKLVFVNNSVHDNESEVVNNATKAKLGGNYWGTMSPKSVKDKMKGDASVAPMKDLKDILRAYLRSELPVITKGMSDQAEAEDHRADMAAKEALKAFKYKQSQADVLAMEAKMKTQTPNATPTPTAPAAPVATATLIASPTMAPMTDINLPTVVPTSVPAVVPVVAPVMSAPVPAAPAVSTSSAASSVPAAPAAPATPAIPEPPAIANGLPAPPMVSPNAPEPPALGDLAGSVPPPPTNINIVPASGSPIPSLPTSVPTSMSSTAPATPTPGLGGGSVSSDDLASIVATAQAASTSTTSTVAPPMPPDMTSLGDASAPAVNTSTPTMMATATYTSVPNVDTSNFTATPTIIFTMAMTDTPTYTSTPMALIATPTPTAPNVSFVPTVAAPASASAAPAVPAGNLVPPPPDFGDSPMQGVQPPMVNTSDASAVPAAVAPSAPAAPATAPAVSAPAASAPAPAIPSASASSAPAAVTPSVPKSPSDLDVDGMQAPPMDSGLDYANPKK